MRLHLLVQLLQRFLLLSQSDRKLVLLDPELCHSLLALSQFTLDPDSVLFYFLGKLDEGIELLLKLFHLLLCLSKLLLVLHRSLQLFLQALNMQLHLLLTPDVVPALGLELAQDLLVLFVRRWDGDLALPEPALLELRV